MIPGPDVPGSTDELSADASPPVVKVDKWAHRRAEPRPLALFWTVFLLVATLGAFASAGRSGLYTLDVYRASARTLLIVISVGVLLLWPMLRLSQIPPARRPIAAGLLDVLVILVPMQAVIWPQAWLAWWTLPTLAGVSLYITGWAVLIGGLVTVAGIGVKVSELGGGRSAGQRAWWMFAFVCFAMAGPGVLAIRSLAGFPDPAPTALWLLSPLTGLFHLTVDAHWVRPGSGPGRDAWLMIGAAPLVAAGVWSYAWLAALGDRRPESIQ